MPGIHRSRGAPAPRLALAALAVSALAGGCARPAERPAPAEDGYAGAAACASCHESEHRAWLASPHGKHGTFDARPEGGADLAVGSKWMQAYLRRDASGRHRIVSTCWDLREKRWRDVDRVLHEIAGPPLDDAKPDSADDLATASRSFETDCAGCHSSQPSFELDVLTGRVALRLVDPSINCETCHGPARAHADAWRRLEDPGPLPRLDVVDARSSVALCARCHGGPPTVGDYGPADAGAYVAQVADRRGFFPDGRASGQVYQHASFGQSPCYLEGGLRCSDCHDSHGPGLRTASATTDDLCVRCHEGTASRAHTFHDPLREGARCLECHMPRVLGGLMSHQRDHRIGVPLPQVEESPDACTACHRDRSKSWASKAWRERWGEPPQDTIAAVRAIAAARRGEVDRPALRDATRHPDAFLRVSAAQWLEDPAALADDPVAEARLFAARGAPATEEGDSVRRRLLRDPEPLVRAAAALGLVRRGVLPPGEELRPDVSVFARHVAGDPDALRALGRWQLDAGDVEGAARTFAGILVFLPEESGAEAGLADALDRSGRREQARALWLRRAEALEAQVRPGEPGAAERAVEAGSSFLRGGQTERAWSVLWRTAMSLPHGPARRQLEEMASRIEPDPAGRRP